MQQQVSTKPYITSLMEASLFKNKLDLRHEYLKFSSNFILPAVKDSFSHWNYHSSAQRLGAKTKIHKQKQKPIKHPTPSGNTETGFEIGAIKPVCGTMEKRIWQTEVVHVMMSLTPWRETVGATHRVCPLDFFFVIFSDFSTFFCFLYLIFF
jgi:hypothetical protein